MKPEEKAFIIKHFHELISNTNLRSGALLTILQQKSVITEEEIQIIECATRNISEYKGCRELYTIMQIKDNGLIMLINALELTKQTQAYAILKNYYQIKNEASVTTRIQLDHTLTHNTIPTDKASKSKSKLVSQLSQTTEKFGKDLVIKHLHKPTFYDSNATTEVRKVHNPAFRLNNRFNTPELVSTFKCPSKVMCVQFDKKKLISGHFDGKIRIWDMTTVQCTHTLNGHGETTCIYDIKFNENIIVSSSKNKILVWDMNTHKIRNWFEENFDTYFYLSLIKNNLVVLEYCKRTLYWFNIQAPGKLCVKAKTHAHDTYCVALDSGDEFVITGSQDKTVKVWQCGSLQLVRTLLGHEETVQCVAYFNRVVVSADSDYVRLWNVDNGKCLRILSAGGRLWYLAVDDIRLLAGYYDQTKIWEIGSILNSDGSSSCQFKTNSFPEGSIGGIRGIGLNDESMIVAAGDTIRYFKFVADKTSALSS